MKRIASYAAALLGAAILTGCQTPYRNTDQASAAAGNGTASDYTSVAGLVDSRWDILSTESDRLLSEESRHPNRATRELRTIPN